VSEATKPPWFGKRSWLRFSLRTLFVIVTVACIALGIVLHRVRARREALRAIDELGGGYSIVIDGPEWLRSIINDDKYFYDISRISFRNRPERPFTDDDLASVIDSINVFRRPKEMDLAETDVTDDGLRLLSRIRNVESVYLYCNPITDAGLANLEPLRSLKTLDLFETNVTEEGVARFKRSVPGCTVQYSNRKNRK
jgi:hypothetical protein